ncbi:MAG: sulfatase-like hydrolase/transferase [Verrucomicrobiae bacterium]|nr:sulfatase-like hydrolase/transferase [Verrucomicrobiae bacterium]
MEPNRLNHTRQPRRCPATILMLGLSLWCCKPLAAAPIPRPLIKDTAHGRPNLVVFLAEGLTYADLPPYGATNRLPHWQQLGAEGMRLDCAYGAGPWPDLAVRGLLTGLPHSAAKTNGALALMAPADAPPLPQMLRERGYATGMLGWWPPGEAWPPLAQGFEEWLGSLDRSEARQVYPRFLHRNQIRHEFNPPATPQRFAAPQLLVTAMTNFVRTSRLYPFYLQIIYPSPATNASRQEWLERLDRDLGLLLATLRAQRVETQTLILAGGLVAPRQAGEPLRPLPAPVGWLRCSTNGVYEGDLRMPLLLRWPGKLKGGTLQPQPLTLPELHATLAAWGDAPLAAATADRSPADYLLQGFPSNWTARGFWENPHTGAEALRDGPWKLVRPERQAPWELYHLEKDPAERENLALRLPEECQRMQALREKQRAAKTR